MRRIRDPWVIEYEWLETRLKVLKIQPIDLNSKKGLLYIADKLRQLNMEGIPSRGMMRVIRRFESFANIIVLSQYKQKNSLFKRIKKLLWKQ